MSNLIKGNKIGTGGLHARLASKDLLDQAAPKPAPTAAVHRIAIIADFSGSMDAPSGGYRSRSLDNEPSSKTKLQLLGDAIQDFAMRSDDSTTAIAVESFPPGFRIALTNDKNEVWLRMFQLSSIGDTPMGIGMTNALEYHSPTRGLLISDGEATDADESYRVAEVYKKKEIIIDTVHIGDSSSGEARLKRIAEITEGIYMKFTNVAAFAGSFHYLLPESRAEIAGMLPAQRSALLGADNE